MQFMCGNLKTWAAGLRPQINVILSLGEKGKLVDAGVKSQLNRAAIKFHEIASRFQNDEMLLNRFMVKGY